MAMHHLQSLLKQYWGHTSFRPLQEPIIHAILAGKDVLALLPTGGGKSICFQLPALCKAGICLVISPLVALMKDQVAQLKKRGLPAEAVFAGMSPPEIDRILDNCIYGQVKFLYVAPERLQTELFKIRVQKMPVNLLVVDEAHCISQWGYDFRPAYLDIAVFKTLLPPMNTVALTATATQEVKKDIQEKLHLQNTAVFQGSSARENLAYLVRKVVDKEKKLLNILAHVPGSAIVYTNTRKKTKLVANFLAKNGLSATCYHAGLTNHERTVRQEAWLQNKLRVMVATTAFGMGIDKPEVRLVVHLDLPTTLEAYYQEAGRAGRDEKKAYAIVLYDAHDLALLRSNMQENHPTIDQLKQVYQYLANYYRIAVGTHAMTSYDFDLDDFSRAYGFKTHEVYQALKKLAAEGLIQLTEGFLQPSKVYISTNPQELYTFQVAHAAYDVFLKGLLRMYGGELFTDFCTISEKRLAQFLHTSTTEVTKQLNALHRLRIIQYRAQKEKPQLTFITPRYPATQLPLNVKKIQQRKTIAISKAEAVIHYITHQHRCSAQLLLEYFGEISYKPCGQCTICVAKKKASHGLQDQTYQRYHKLILQGVQQGHSISAIVHSINDPQAAEDILITIRQMLDNELLTYDPAGKLAVLKQLKKHPKGALCSLVCLM